MESKLGAVFGYMVTAVASPALRMYVRSTAPAVTAGQSRNLDTHL